METLEDAIRYCENEAQRFEFSVMYAEKEHLAAPEETFREIAEMYRKFAGWFEELLAYRKALEEMRSLPQVWEEGAGINKCITIVEKNLEEGSGEND